MSLFTVRLVGGVADGKVFQLPLASCVIVPMIREDGLYDAVYEVYSINGDQVVATWKRDRKVPDVEE